MKRMIVASTIEEQNTVYIDIVFNYIETTEEVAASEKAKRTKYADSQWYTFIDNIFMWLQVFGFKVRNHGPSEKESESYYIKCNIADKDGNMIKDRFLQFRISQHFLTPWRKEREELQKKKRKDAWVERSDDYYNDETMPYLEDKSLKEVPYLGLASIVVNNEEFKDYTDAIRYVRYLCETISKDPYNAKEPEDIKQDYMQNKDNIKLDESKEKEFEKYKKESETEESEETTKDNTDEKDDNNVNEDEE